MTCGIQKVNGNVYYRLADGSLAVNVQGMEAGLFAKYLELLAREMGKASTVRNADHHEVSNLGYGVWYVIEEAK